MLYRLISLAIYAFIIVSTVRGLNYAFTKMYSSVKTSIEHSYAQAQSEYDRAIAEAEAEGRPATY